MTGDGWERAVAAALEDVVAPALHAAAVAAVLAAVRPMREQEWVDGFRQGWTEGASLGGGEAAGEIEHPDPDVAPVVPLCDAIPSAREMSRRAADPSAPRALFARAPARRRGQT